MFIKIFSLALLLSCLGCFTSEPAYIQGDYIFHKKDNTYTVRHRYSGKINPYNFIVDLQYACYEYFDSFNHWPKNKSELLTYMESKDYDTKRVKQLVVLKFHDLEKELKIEFTANKPKTGFIFFPKPIHLNP